MGAGGTWPRQPLTLPYYPGPGWAPRNFNLSLALEELPSWGVRDKHPQPQGERAGLDGGDGKRLCGAREGILEEGTLVQGL